MTAFRLHIKLCIENNFRTKLSKWQLNRCFELLNCLGHGSGKPLFENTFQMTAKTSLSKNGPWSEILISKFSVVMTVYVTQISGYCQNDCIQNTQKTSRLKSFVQSNAFIDYITATTNALAPDLLYSLGVKSIFWKNCPDDSKDRSSNKRTIIKIY